MRAIQSATVAVLVVTAVAASPSTASAAPQDAAGCQAKIDAAATEPLLFAGTTASGRSLRGRLFVPDNRKLTVDAVADSEEGYGGSQAGVRDLFRISSQGLSHYAMHEDNQLRPVPVGDDGETWIKASSLSQSRKFLDCAATLHYTPYS